MRNRRPAAPRKEFNLEHALLDSQQPSFAAWHIPEPRLLFAGNHQGVDPKTGLGQFGPLSIGGRPIIHVGIVGTGESIDAAQRWLDSSRSTVIPSPRRTARGKMEQCDPVLFPQFPGISATSTFRCEIQTLKPEILSPDQVARIVNLPGQKERIEAAANAVGDRLRAYTDKETRPDVVIVALPTEFEKYCAGTVPRARRKQPAIPLAERRLMKRIERDRRVGQKFLFDMAPAGSQADPEDDAGHRNLRRSLKVRAMACGIPVQVVWPRTFAHSAGTEDEATIAWNLIAGLYYKAGGIPWRVIGLESGTCYVGISFYREQGQEGTLRASMAQAFSESTDGIVLRGEPFHWERSDHEKSPHLTHDGARSLLGGLLEVYEKTTHQKPRRVVIHKSSRFSKDELDGFRDALGQIQFYDFVTLAPSRMRFLRIGYEPPVRGTVIDLGSSRHLIYTRGYVPFFRIYPGMRIPIPLEIMEHYGNGSIRPVCAEILALTKMNWNTASFACAEPMTLAFSREVGYILSELPRNQDPKSSYRFYM